MVSRVLLDFAERFLDRELVSLKDLIKAALAIQEQPCDASFVVGVASNSEQLDQIDLRKRCYLSTDIAKVVKGFIGGLLRTAGSRVL